MKTHPAAAAALRTAGSADLSPQARAELDARIARFGAVERARNVGGVACGKRHKHGTDGACVRELGRWMEVFPTWEDGAERAIELARLASLEGSFAPPGPPEQAILSGFRTVAPSEGDPPILVSHTDGADDETGAEPGANEELRAELYQTLAGVVGGMEQAEADVARWAAVTPKQRARLREEIRAKAATEAATAGADLGELAGVPDGVDVLDLLAGTDDETGATKKKKAKKAKKAKKPTGAELLRAKTAAWKANAAAKKAREEAAQLRAELSQTQADAQAQLDQAQADAQAAQASQGQGFALPEQAGPDGSAEAFEAPAAPLQVTITTDQLREAESRAEEASELATEAETHAAGLAGIFGPSDASAKAFQELAATWAGFERVPGIDKTPGYTITRKAWQDFAHAWQTGDADENALNAMIHDAERLRAELAASRPNVAAELKTPAAVPLDQREVVMATIDKYTKPFVANLPGLEAVTNPARGAFAVGDRLVKGEAPRHHYLIGGVVLAALAALVVKLRAK